MDSRPQIVYLFERHTCKYERKPSACSFNFSPFSHLPADLSYQLKKCNFSADSEDLDQFSAFH